MFMDTGIGYIGEGTALFSGRESDPRGLSWVAQSPNAWLRAHT